MKIVLFERFLLLQLDALMFWTIILHVPDLIVLGF